MQASTPARWVETCAAITEAASAEGPVGAATAGAVTGGAAGAAGTGAATGFAAGTSTAVATAPDRGLEGAGGDSASETIDGVRSARGVDPAGLGAMAGDGDGEGD